MLFNFKRRKQCPATYELRTATGLHIRTERCNLDVDHGGQFHVSTAGQAWLNTTPLLRKIEDALK